MRQAMAARQAVTRARRAARRIGRRDEARDEARVYAEARQAGQPGGYLTRRRWARMRRGEEPAVPRAEFGSYYGKPVISPPVWEARDIAGYLFLGGLAGGSSLLAAGADLTGRPALAKVAKAAALSAGAASMGLLVHDLGRPGRFLNMLRVVKVTSPMSVGSWLLAGYVPAAGIAAASALTGRLPRAGRLATAGAAVLAPAVAAYTAALISDTAVPAWHEGYREMPFVFTGSGAMAAGGLGLLGVSLTGTRLPAGAAAAEAAPARNLALLGTAMELAAFSRMEHRLGMLAEPYSQGTAGRYVRAGKLLALAGAAGVTASGVLAGQEARPAGGAWQGYRGLLRWTAAAPVPSGMDRAGLVVAALSGAALIGASAATRWGIFHAGMESARDQKYTVVPQRDRLTERAKADGGHPPA